MVDGEIIYSNYIPIMTPTYIIKNQKDLDNANKIMKEVRNMSIKKKVKCLRCQEIVEGMDMRCGCGKVIICENVIITAITKDIDYEDLTPKLLVE